MIVAGGYYQERCVSPANNVVFGSGGRAATAIASAGLEVDWHYYCPLNDQETARISFPKLRHHPATSDKLVSFTYFHPLSKPEYAPFNPTQHAPITVNGDHILRFGFMEGDAIVHGDKVVFDPQSPDKPASFAANGSTANSLAIVLNSKEVLSAGRAKSEAKAVETLAARDSAYIVIVKGGPHGCRVYVKGEFRAAIPPYLTDRVYKVGSGDVFSAAFAYHWAERGLAPEAAADAASRCVARYCRWGLPSVELNADTEALEPLALNRKRAKIYIAGPFFTMAELWLVEEACMAFDSLGVPYFSPYHEAGVIREHTDDEIRRTVEADLNGLNGCTAVFAILDGCDPGTIFEVGYAVRKKIPVVALSQNPKEGDQTMIRGSDRCYITNDFASAIYRAAWESWRE